MGWAQRLRLERQRNGEESRPDPLAPVEHAAWCQGIPACTCYPIPALQCDACQAVFVAAPDETAIEFHRRVRLHAMVHPDGNPSFTQGRVERVERRHDDSDPQGGKP